MRFNVVHHGRKWRRVENHLDARHCPYCGITVHGNWGQAFHDAWHTEQDDLLENLCKRTGITEEEISGRSTWTAVVDGGDDPGELEAAE